MLLLARLMLHAGMIATLADAAARLGPWWIPAAPAVGALGAFVTGSATASNILFTEFQVAAADAVDAAAVVVAAAQGVGAGIGNVVAPHNIIAGCATVAAAGQEGAIMRRTAPVCLLCLLLLGAMTAALVR